MPGKLAATCAYNSWILKDISVHTKRTHNTALPANITDTATKYCEPGWMDGGDRGETASFTAVHVHKEMKKKKEKKKSK